MEPAQKFFDLSHTVEHGMITYKGLPGPIISDHLSRVASQDYYEPGTEFQIGRIEMVANTGTYLDSPFHRYAGGADLAGLELHSLANLEGVIVRHLEGERAITAAAIADLELAGKAILFHTGWDRFWRTEAYSDGNHPFLTAGAAHYLASTGVVLVGIDSYNIDDTNDRSRPVHSILLQQGIPVVEHLCGLAKLPDDGFRFFAVPVKVKGFGTFPVRAFAIVGDCE
ncbi:MAG: arylformamidase [Pyrinomonadaceae bacterium]|jgi:kynurenine formamidase|nr:arylformamidase [Pyrinomonadaceae bacterium]